MSSWLVFMALWCVRRGVRLMLTLVSHHRYFINRCIICILTGEFFTQSLCTQYRRLLSVSDHWPCNGPCACCFYVLCTLWVVRLFSDNIPVHYYRAVQWHCAERANAHFRVNAPELNVDTPSPLTSTLCSLHSVDTVPLNSHITSLTHFYL